MIEDEFLRRYEAWKRFVEEDANCQLASSDTPFIDNPPFRAIVELGPAAVPAIMANLFRDDYSHFLHHALRELVDHEFSPEERAAAIQLFGHLGNQAECGLWLGWWIKNRNEFRKR
jgi:hypothetical protein